MPEPASQPRNVKVIYVAGAGRSGSTILANILGQAEGFFSTGELYHLWIGPPDQRLCSCKDVLSECPVWKTIFAELFADSRWNSDDLLAMRNAGARTRYLPFLLMPGVRARLLAQLGDYLEFTGRLYSTICSATGNRVIVDSSKVTLYACLLGLIPTIDLRVIHLVRDPRAVAFSFLRKKPHPTLQGVVYTPRYNIVKSALLWDVFNASTEIYLRQFARQYIRVGYEDFAGAPRQVVQNILADMDEGQATIPFLSDTSVKLTAHHTVGGNPDRFRVGDVSLKVDDEWKTAMIPWQRFVVTCLTWPLLLKYRYLSTGRSA